MLACYKKVCPSKMSSASLSTGICFPIMSPLHNGGWFTHFVFVLEQSMLYRLSRELATQTVVALRWWNCAHNTEWRDVETAWQLWSWGSQVKLTEFEASISLPKTSPSGSEAFRLNPKACFSASSSPVQSMLLVLSNSEGLYLIEVPPGWGYDPCQS